MITRLLFVSFVSKLTKQGEIFYGWWVPCENSISFWSVIFGFEPVMKPLLHRLSRHAWDAHCPCKCWIEVLIILILELQSYLIYLLSEILLFPQLSWGGDRLELVKERCCVSHWRGCLWHLTEISWRKHEKFVCFLLDVIIFNSLSDSHLLIFTGLSSLLQSS